MRVRCIGGPWDGRVLSADGSPTIDVPVPVDNPKYSEQDPWEPPFIAMDRVRYHLHREYLPFSHRHVLAYVAEKHPVPVREAIYGMIERLWNSAE